MSGIGSLYDLGLDQFRKIAVWSKGHEIVGFDKTEWRRDDFGNILCYSDHGNRQSEHGWEIDHIVPTALSGSDDISNLRPLHCAANAGLGGLLGNLRRSSDRH
ncbi:MAG: HNH endonuclease signature motif containing protein [Rhizobiaceae bacterium]